MDERLRSLSLGISSIGIAGPMLERHARDYHEAQRYLMVFTQDRMWTAELRQEAWERATKLRASVLQPLTMPNALATVIGDMEEECRKRKKSPPHASKGTGREGRRGRR